MREDPHNDVESVARKSVQLTARRRAAILSKSVACDKSLSRQQDPITQICRRGSLPVLIDLPREQSKASKGNVRETE